MMRLVADENLEAAIIARLRGDGHDLLVISERSPRLADEEVLRIAVDDGRILITNDKDFAELVFLQGKLPHGVILLRMPRLSTDSKSRRVAQVLADGTLRFEGAMVVVEVDVVRRRPMASRPA